MVRLAGVGDAVERSQSAGLGKKLSPINSGRSPLNFRDVFAN